MRKVTYCKGKTPKELMDKVESVYRDIEKKEFKIINSQYVFEATSWGAFIEYETK